MTMFSERTIENPVVLMCSDENQRPELPKFTAFAMRDGLPCFCLIRVWARNPMDAIDLIENDPRDYQVMGVVSGHHTDAIANLRCIPAYNRTEASFEASDRNLAFA